MYPRLRIDISWSELARAVGYCVWAGDDSPAALSTTDAGEEVITLSVRSAFDVLLAVLELPEGSELLLSEITVPHMATIAREHGCAPVGVPVDPRTLAVDPQEVKSRLTPQTKMLVVAHLFGSRMPLEELGTLCRQRGILLVEDCAQALTSRNLDRHATADVSLYSFGPIKTATALGGGIALVRDSDLRNRIEAFAAEWPPQSSMSYLFRVLKAGGLKLLSAPWLLTPLVRCINACGGDSDAFVGHSARGFPDDRLFELLRQRPCPALRKLIAYRLSHVDKSSMCQRIRRGQQLAGCLPDGFFVAGCDNPTHTFWVFPLVCDRPVDIVSVLRSAGFDASQISGLTILGDDSPDHWFRRTVFVPCGVQVPPKALHRGMDLIRSSTRCSTSRGAFLP